MNERMNEWSIQRAWERKEKTVNEEIEKIYLPMEVPDYMSLPYAPTVKQPQTLNHETKLTGPAVGRVPLPIWYLAGIVGGRQADQLARPWRSMSTRWSGRER